ncbi:unnamed protein product, partial [Mesorhabditis spiculigera]
MNRFCRDFAALKTDVRPKYKTVRRDAYAVDRGAVKLLRKCHGFTTTLRPSHEIERMSNRLLLNLAEPWRGDLEAPLTDEEKKQRILGQNLEKFTTTEEHWRDVTQGEGDVKNFRYFVDAVSTGNGPTILVAHEVDHVHYDGARSVDTKTFCAPGFNVKRPAVEQLKAGHILQWVLRAAPLDVTLCVGFHAAGQLKKAAFIHPDTIMDNDEKIRRNYNAARAKADDFFRQLKDLVPGEPFFKVTLRSGCQTATPLQCTIIRRADYVVKNGEMFVGDGALATTLRPLEEIQKSIETGVNLFENWEEYTPDETNRVGAIHRLKFLLTMLAFGTAVAFETAVAFCGAGDYSKILLHLIREWKQAQRPDYFRELEIFVVRLGDRLLLNLAEPVGRQDDIWKKKMSCGNKFEQVGSIGAIEDTDKSSVKAFQYFVDEVKTRDGPAVLLAHEVDQIGYDGRSSVNMKTVNVAWFDARKPLQDQLKGMHVFSWLLRNAPLGVKLLVGQHSAAGVLENVALIDPEEIMAADIRRDYDSARKLMDEFLQQLSGDKAPKSTCFKVTIRQEDWCAVPLKVGRAMCTFSSIDGLMQK